MGEVAAMKIISFGKTTPALLAGEKTVTRRDWAQKHARMFHAGEVVQAWSQTPRVPGAERVATIRLTEAPTLQWTRTLPAEDFAAEGFAYMEREGLLLDGVPVREVWANWQRWPQLLYVVRFELLEVGSGAEGMYATGAAR